MNEVTKCDLKREDIERMAVEAGGGTPEWDGIWELSGDALERFAALVAAAEQEKVAAWMRSKSYATGHGDTIEDLLKELEWQVAEREREACAKECVDIAEEFAYEPTQPDPWYCAEAIRAISQWRFRPAIKAGKAVPCWCFQKVNFEFTR